jgi:hypothetical protein
MIRIIDLDQRASAAIGLWFMGDLRLAVEMATSSPNSF